ncbi:uncharacterized protein RHOBADRAFT_42923 [Rhodotorula graminis WP1]|uniref:Uncharacterized protein n=1 Tax=Rhodotorula graminis (strain WP1) TaxID=578459 RepID=A0A194SB06_RHOGW|nr:uncharacterized protein RHOBADRAFT_42923 [Rhodotorula graminis WP1]KPV76581.1 hypothetical protein RHOBADRAFT_42923 [Rhodotorula graminis WP1]
MRPASHELRQDAPADRPPSALQFEAAVRAAAGRVRAALARVAPEHDEVARDSKGRVDWWEGDLLGEAVVREYAELPRSWQKKQVLDNLNAAAEHMAHTAQLGVVQPPARIDIFHTHSLAHPPLWLEPLVPAASLPRPPRVHALRGSSQPPRAPLPRPLSDALRVRGPDEQREYLEQRERDSDEEDPGVGASRSGSPRPTYELGGRRLDRRIGLRTAARYGIDPAAFARGY